MSKEIKIAIAGIGNCASSLVQGINFYRSVKDGETIPGLLHPILGGYSPAHIKIVAAFDIDQRKVGKDVSEAIFAKPNNTIIFCKDIEKTGTIVQRGPTMDGYPAHFDKYDVDVRFIESDQKPVDVISVLKETKPDIFINYLPVGSEKASHFYADACLEAGVSFINAMPVFISSQKEYIDRFKEKGLVCAGDDIKSQVGATIVHRVLTDLFEKRGIKLTETYQLNVGGNTDFLNMLDRSRLEQKKISKTEAVQSQLEQPLQKNRIHIGPSDYVEWLHDQKVCYIVMKGQQFGGIPMNLELKLSVEDSPNSAGVMIDIVRLAKLALDKNMAGYLDEVSAFGFKHPLHQYPDAEVFLKLSSFIEKVSK